MQHSGFRAALRTCLACFLVLACGSAGYVIIEGVSLFDALYMAAITLTTIGFGEVFPLSQAGRLFTIVIGFAGVGVILLAASEVGRVVLQADIGRMIGIRRDLSMIKKLTNHIVVCGHGRMGRAAVGILRKRKVPFCVVEFSAERCKELKERRIPFICGDATKEKVLEEARISRARTLITCLADDAHNVFAILLARQLKPGLQIIARAVEEEAEERLSLAGADRVINPYRLGGMRLALGAIKPTAMEFIESSLAGLSRELELTEIVVHQKSELAGKTLAGADVRRRFGIIVVALKRGEAATFNPGPDTQMMAGDVLVALGPTKAIEEVEQASR